MEDWFIVALAASVVSAVTGFLLGRLTVPMRSCVYCHEPLHRNNPSNRCGPCAKALHCRDCGKPKQDPSRSRCDACREVHRKSTRHFANKPGRGPEPPPWLEARIAELAWRAERRLPLFG